MKAAASIYYSGSNYQRIIKIAASRRDVALRNHGRFDSVSLAGVAVFGALSVVFAYFSQLLGLNFPIVPYLQFDFGEVAIILALFIFGPIPALFSSFVEFVTLMAVGQNVPIGPTLKLFAMVSTVFGVWLGVGIASRLKRVGLGGLFGWGTALGAFVRALVMTIPNYYLLVFFYTVPGIVGYVSGAFKLVGVNLTAANALTLILAFTGLFNVLQLSVVMLISFLVLKLPQVGSLRTGGKPPWFVALSKQNARVSPAVTQTSSA